MRAPRELIPQRDLTPERLAALASTASTRERLLAMALAARALRRADAAARVADVCVELAEPRR